MINIRTVRGDPRDDICPLEEDTSTFSNIAQNVHDDYDDENERFPLCCICPTPSNPN